MEEHLCKHGNYHCNICEIDLQKKVIEELREESKKYRAALERIADLHTRGIEDSGANQHRRIAAEALAR